jgi:hypothetical protein
MKATLEFDLVEDSEDFQMASRYAQNYHILWELRHNFRRQFEYLTPEMEKKSKAEQQAYFDGIERVLDQLEYAMEDFIPS